MTLLEDLYYGNLNPNESFRRSGTYSKALKALVAQEENLEKSLTDEQKEIFNKLQNCQSNFNAVGESDSFIKGFRLGVRIAIEMMRAEEE